NVLCAALVIHRRRPGDYAKLRDLRERSNRLLGDTVIEPFVLGISADVCERQHGKTTLINGGGLCLDRRCQRIGWPLRSPPGWEPSYRGGNQQKKRQP